MIGAPAKLCGKETILRNLNSLIRSTPPDLLRAFVGRAEVEHDVFPALPVADRDWTRLVRAGIEQMPLDSRDELEGRAERVAGMSDEPGEIAIYSVTRDKSVIDELPTGMARAVWMFLNDDPGFRRAEDVRYTDEKRGGRMWGGYAGPQGADLQRCKDTRGSGAAGLDVSYLKRKPPP